jgi:hypothetical protein
MELDLLITLRNLDKRLRSFTNHEGWTIAVYSLSGTPGTPGKPSLQRVESVGGSGNEAMALVAHAAWVTRTTVVGDVGRIAASLREPSEIEKYQVYGVHTIGAGVVGDKAQGSVIAAPCLDPQQTITNDRVPPRAIGVLAVAGNLPALEAIANTDLRYLIEQYAKSAVSFLEAPPREQRRWFYPISLPDLEILPQKIPTTYASRDGVIESFGVSKVPRYSRVEVFPNESVRISGYGKDFEPYTAGNETWLQFGPGLAVSKAGLEAFVRGWAQRRADADYVQGLGKP